MTKFRAVDENNDWIFGSGQQAYTKNDLAIDLDVKTKLQVFLTECFFNIELGLPWFQLLGSKDKNAIILYIKQAIMNVEGVTNISELEFSIDNDRNATIRYVIDTIYTTQLAGTVNL